MPHDFTHSARIGGRGSPQAPRNHQTPARRAIRASSLKLPGASASGAFSAGVKHSLTPQPPGISGWLQLSGGAPFLPLARESASRRIAAHHPSAAAEWCSDGERPTATSRMLEELKPTALDLFPGSAPSRGPGVARHCVAGAVHAAVQQGRGCAPRPPIPVPSADRGQP